MNEITLTIADTLIRRDAEGRYNLNDLHKAAGGAKRHQPSDWLRLQQTQELIAELSTPGNPGVTPIQPVNVINGGKAPGTYVCKELVYAYAMWISARFHVVVIRAYDTLVVAGASPGLKPLPDHAGAGLPDDFGDTLRAYLAPRERVTLPQILADLLGVSAAESLRRLGPPVGKLMKREFPEWRYVHPRIRGKAVYGYIRHGGATAAAPAASGSTYPHWQMAVDSLLLLRMTMQLRDVIRLASRAPEINALLAELARSTGCDWAGPLEPGELGRGSRSQPS